MFQKFKFQKFKFQNENNENLNRNIKTVNAFYT